MYTQLFFISYSYIVMLNSYEAVKEVYINSGGVFMDRNAEAMANLFGVKDSKQSICVYMYMFYIII